MANFNQCNFIGNLTRDVELKHLDSGAVVGNFTLAINRTYKDKSDQKQEEAVFLDFEIWNKRAETLAQYTSKGQQILVVARAKQDKWTNDEGQNRIAIRFVVEDFQFLGSKKNAETSEDTAEPATVGEGITF